MTTRFKLKCPPSRARWELSSTLSGDGSPARKDWVNGVVSNTGVSRAHAFVSPLEGSEVVISVALNPDQNRSTFPCPQKLVGTQLHLQCNVVGLNHDAVPVSLNGLQKQYHFSVVATHRLRHVGR